MMHTFTPNINACLENMRVFSSTRKSYHYVKKFSTAIILSVAVFTVQAQQVLLQKRANQEIAFKDDKKVESFVFNETLQTPQLIKFKGFNTISKAASPNFIKSYFGLNDAADDVKFDSETTTPYGVSVTKYQQYYNGLKVQQGTYSLIMKNNLLQAISAESYPTIETGLATTPTLTERQALQKCLDFVKADVYTWDALQLDIDKVVNPSLKEKLMQELQKILPLGKLVYSKDLYGDLRAHLAYRFEINTQKPLGKYIIYIDASSGKVLLRDAIIKNTVEINEQNSKNAAYLNSYLNYKSSGFANSIALPNNAQLPNNLLDTKANTTTPNSTIPVQQQAVPLSFLGTAKTRYAGVRQIYTSQITAPTSDPNNSSLQLQYSGVDPRTVILSGTVYILKDDTRGKGISTYDLNGVGGAPVSLPMVHSSGLSFVDLDNIWKDEPAGSMTNEDLMRGAAQPPSNNGDPNESVNDDMAIDAHWGAGIVYDYWNVIHGRKSYDNKDATINSYVHYGIAYDNAFWDGTEMTYGDGKQFRPLVSLDVCAHEIGHGVCSNTADLVYAGESGGMNEGLSDIWASCVENYALNNVDNTLPYQVFQVGEQIDIASPNIGLRRQDNPKAFKNPDTYNGRYWVTTAGCTPSLANDQCGVHNNSGVLNKWFYLLVRGPKATTGLPAYTDDGIADAVGKTSATENIGNNYGLLAPTALGGTNEFLPLGFSDAEKITYLMELSMPASSSFATARLLSIQAAATLFGPCSQQVITTTDAWYAVGVGAKWAGCTAPVIDVFTNAPTSLKEGATGGCIRYNDYIINANLNTAQVDAVTINFTTSGTATYGHNFELSATSITYTAGETGLKPITLRVFDDAITEPTETIVINATNTALALNKTFNFSIEDNDPAPIIGDGLITLMNEDFESTTDGALPAGWAIINQITPTPVNWVVRTAPAVSPIAFTTQRLIIEIPAVPGHAAYDQNSAAATLIKTSLINATGLNTINVKFTYSAGGEPACSPACDYGQLKYSLDGVNFSIFQNDVGPLFVQATDSVYNITLPATFNNKQFYLGFQWVNDANGGTSNSVTIDNLIVTAKGRQVEGDLNHTVVENIYAEGTAPAYFYGTDDGKIIASLTNITQDLGCVTATLSQSGNNIIPFGTTSSRTAKVFEVTPTNNITSANHRITLYFKREELAAWGTQKPNLMMMKSDATNIDQSNSSNSIIVTPVFNDYTAQGYTTYTADFTGFSKFVMVAPYTTLPIAFIDFTVTNQANILALNWQTGGSGTAITSYIVERGIAGSGEFKPIAKLLPNSLNKYVYNDAAIDLNTVYEYRIQQLDVANKILYSAIRIGTINGKIKFDFTVANNPTRQGKKSKIIFNQAVSPVKISVIGVNGTVFIIKDFKQSMGNAYELNTDMLPAGTYHIKAVNKDQVLVKKLIIQ